MSHNVTFRVKWIMLIVSTILVGVGLLLSISFISVNQRPDAVSGGAIVLTLIIGALLGLLATGEISIDKCNGVKERIVISRMKRGNFRSPRVFRNPALFR